MTGLAKVAVLVMGLGIGGGTLAAQYAQPAQKPPAHPYTKQHIYSETADPKADIEAALKQARAEHKRVILDFGGDWCPDCQVLDIYFHQSANADLLAKYFVRVNINIGRMDANKDIAAKYGVPLNGVPALAVLDGDGKVVYAQNKEFSDMRHLDSSALTAFLGQWKP